MVFSRFALGPVRPLPVSNGGLSVEVGAPRPFRLLAVHTAQPVDEATRWHRDLLEVRRRAAAAVRGGPTRVVGDFNATRDHPWFRAILGVGLRDAAEQANAGWQPTWPTGARAWYLRPLITIDHVLVSAQFEAVDTGTVAVQGSDHQALVVDLHRR
jgi:endonuclease/exonuclease/phosphatase family metal-dependent hydrolase